MTTLRLHAGSPRGRHFNLVEILISLAILIVSLFILMGAVPAALRNLDTTKANLYAPQAALTMSTWLQQYLNEKVQEVSNADIITDAPIGADVAPCLVTSFGYWTVDAEGVSSFWLPEIYKANVPTGRKLPTASLLKTLPAVPPTIAPITGLWSADPYAEIDDSKFTLMYQTQQGYSLYKHKTLLTLFKYKAKTLIGSTEATDFEAGIRIWQESQTTLKALSYNDAQNTTGDGTGGVSFDYWTGADGRDFKTNLNFFRDYITTGVAYGPFTNNYNHPCWRTSRARSIHILVSWPVTDQISQRIARGNFFHATRLIKGNTLPDQINYAMFDRANN